MTDAATLIPFLVFCVVLTGTPGPNNMMALASGVRVGVRRSMPLVSGIAVGVALQLVAVGLGLGAVLHAHPAVHDVMRIAGAAFLIWLAYKIASSGPIGGDTEERAPLGFMGAVAFQWINPKAWVITTGATAAYIPADGYALNLAVAAALMAAISVPCVSIWSAGGSALRRLLVQPAYAHAFNIAAAVLLVAATVPILLGA